MKALLLTIAVIVSLIASVFSQKNISVDEIITKHIDARGGTEAWGKVETIKYSGTFTGFSIAKPFTTIQKQPNLYRSDFGLGKYNVVLAYNGDMGWTIDPWFDVPFPRELGKSELNVVQQKAEFCSPFLNYKQKGYKVEYLGEETLEGIKTHKIKLIRNEQNTEIWYLNAETFLEYKQESTWDDFGYSTPQESYFDDFRKVEEITLPFYIERSYIIRNRITEIEQVTINDAIKNSVFEIPISKEMEKLEPYEGDWILTVKALNRRGWFKADSITCKIEKHHNSLQTTLSYTNYFKQNKQLTWSYHSNSEKYRMTLYDGFSSSMEMYAGSFNQDTLIMNSMPLTDSIGSTPNLNKFSIRPISNKSFTIEVSTLNNDNWVVNEKLIFYRVPKKD